MQFKKLLPKYMQNSVAKAALWQIWSNFKLWVCICCLPSIHSFLSSECMVGTWWRQIFDFGALEIWDIQGEALVGGDLCFYTTLRQSVDVFSAVKQVSGVKKQSSQQAVVGLLVIWMTELVESLGKGWNTALSLWPGTPESQPLLVASA